MSAAAFRKRPVEVEAIRFTGGNHIEVCEFFGGEDGAPHEHFDGNTNGFDPSYDKDATGGCVEVYTREGVMTADVGDWIIREPFPTDDRGFYPCKPDIFEATYEASS